MPNGIILCDTQSIMDTPQLAEKIIAAASLPGNIGKQTFYLGANIGMSIFSIDSDDASALFKCAETALYQARSAGPNTFRFYSAQLNATAMEQLAIEHELREALERGEFRLHYQPVFNVASHVLSGVEALLRWQHPKRGLLAPESFLEVAEHRGLMPGIGAWAIGEACRMAQIWRNAGEKPLRIAVNVSAQQLLGSEILGVVDEALAKSGLAASSLVIELTESMMQGEQARDNLVALRARGIQIAIDDFGTGFSSLAYLRKFPVDVLKIDRSFLTGLPDDHKDGAIVRTIIAMARNLELTVVAEGVETLEQLEFLRELGCDEAQGYFLAHPLEADAFALRHGFKPSIPAMGKVS